jgi:hypothetical protein
MRMDESSRFLVVPTLALRLDYVNGIVVVRMSVRVGGGSIWPTLRRTAPG